MSPVGAHELVLISPMLVIFGFGLFVLVAPFVATYRDDVDQKGSLVTALMGIAFAAVFSMVLLDGAANHPETAFNGMVRIDGFAIFVHYVILIAAAGMLVLGHDYLGRIGVRVPEYNALVLFSVFGMMLLAVANNLILLFLAVEVMSIALYVLCGINRGELKSVESAFKYFILGAFSSAILLYGIAFVYGATGSMRIDAIGVWLQDGHSISGSPIMAVGVAMLLVGFGFKVAAVPFHMWSPDVYEGAPTPVTAFMATGVKAASFAAFGRVVFVALLHGKMDLTPALWAMAALTILLGNIGALVQTDLKRMLAYSSIAHAGYLLMALVAAPAAGLQANPRIGGLLFYLLAYTVMNLGAFAVVSMFARDGREDTRIDRLAGLAQRHPWIAAGLSVSLLSLAGIPPTMGFVGKFYLFAAAVEGGFVGLAVIGAIGGAIGVYYYLRPIVLMYMRPATERFEPASNTAALATLGIAAALLFVFGLVPGPIVDWARDSLLSLVG